MQLGTELISSKTSELHILPMTNHAPALNPNARVWALDARTPFEMKPNATTMFVKLNGRFDLVLLVKIGVPLRAEKRGSPECWAVVHWHLPTKRNRHREATVSRI
jgi:hypothetical protein